MNRRDFLKLGAELTALSFADFPLLGKQPDGFRPLSDADAFNYVVGTQTFGASYQFTKKPRLVETAEEIRGLGSSVLKFKLGDVGKGEQGFSRGFRSLSEIVANDAATLEVLGMPFGHYLLWAYALGENRNNPGDTPRDEEVYDLCCHLLRTYSGSRKSFYVGHWEGDWELRGRAGGTADPEPERIERKIKWLNRRQQAVDDARRNTPHQDVAVFCYAEVNLLRDAMKGRPTMTNSVIPHTDIDFVSYSSYDTSNGKNAGVDVPEALDYIESKLKPKAGVQGKRVWIGEYGYPAHRFSPAEQDARSRTLIKTALRWGCPFVLYWEMYNNEVDANGKQRGFWMIDDKGARQPVYYSHKRLCEWARSFVRTSAQRTGRVPSSEEYRRAALDWMDSERWTA